MSIDLKPCPFCGGEAGLGHSADGSFANCLNCLASTNHLTAHKEPPEEAVRRWNSRVQPAGIDLEPVRVMLEMFLSMSMDDRIVTSEGLVRDCLSHLDAIEKQVCTCEPYIKPVEGGKVSHLCEYCEATFLEKPPTDRVVDIEVAAKAIYAEGEYVRLAWRHESESEREICRKRAQRCAKAWGLQWK